MTETGLADLIARARQGDAAAFGDLVDVYRNIVYRAALAALRSPEEAEDVTQETFMAAYQKLEGFRGEASFKTWLVAIAWRKALDRRASMRRWWPIARTNPGKTGDPTNAVEHLPARSPSHEDEFLSSELAAHIRRLVGSLPARLRDPLLLIGSGDHTYDEAAAVLGAPTGTVKWRVSEARRRLRQHLAWLGYTDD